MRFKDIRDLVQEAVSSWVDDYAASMGAALAYYTVFSITPLLLIVISVAGMVFGEEAARGEIFAQLSGLMGEEGAMAVQGLLQSFQRPGTGIFAASISAVVLLVGATTVFAELQNSLDRIWRAPARDQIGGLWGLVRARLLSFGMILGIGFLLIVSLIVSAALAALGRWWGATLGNWQLLASVLNVLVSFAFVTALFAMIYKLMPRVKIAWTDVWIGAAVTALLFSIGKFLIGQYIGRSGIASGFGAAASLIVVLTWVYYSAQIFLMGAEFTWVYAHRFGSLKGRARPGAATGVPTRSAPLDAAPSRAPDPPATQQASRRGRATS